jgi:predicted metal-dependent HD superfamily phosphohydrolase
MYPLTAADLVPGTLVQHWKGGLYRIEALAVREADGQADVVYRPLADPARRAWTRPLHAFVETVSTLDGDSRPRFVPVPLPDDGALRAAAATAGIGADLVDATLARYAEPQRHYHASWHVHDVFARAAAHGLALTRAQVLALLFHDAVYVAGADAGSNEALSALLLRQAAHGRADLPGDEVEHACAMIRDTAGHQPGSAESEVVIALDLATLGDPPVRFDTWTELVWLEYRHLFAGEADPRRAFIERRVRVLEALLQARRGQSVHEAAFDAAFAANVARLARRTPH